MDTITVHQPVHLQSALNYLNIIPNAWYLDATLGGGGHTIAIAQKGGNVISFDQDQTAIERVTQRLKSESKEIVNRITLIHGNFSNISDKLASLEITHLFAGILFDLGLSSDQLEDPHRGFSFLRAGPLDMRMDNTAHLTAATIVNTWNAKDLAQLFREAADEPRASQISSEIVKQRQLQQFNSTIDLADFISRITHQPRTKIHPATRVFQALRIAVNQEFTALMTGLQSAWQVLSPQGRLVVISFHSGEDRLIKHFFSYQQALGANLLTKKPIKVDQEEVDRNPRARSAKLRAIEKQ